MLEKEDVFFYLQVALGLLLGFAGFLLFYSYWRAQGGKNARNRQPAQVKDLSADGIQSDAVNPIRLQTVERGTNTDPPLQGLSVDGSKSVPKVPLGVPMRPKRGRGSALDKRKRKAGVWPDSGLPASCVILEPSRVECPVNCIRENIGHTGGILTIAGCFLLIPPNALASEHEIGLTCFYDEPPVEDPRFMDMTPTIKLEPSGLKFQRPVTVVLPSYYDAANPSKLADVQIQMKQAESDTWEECKTVTNHLSKKIIFHVDHFTKFRGILTRLQSHLLKKQLYYAAFVKRYRLQEIPKIRVLVWCLCDNLPHTVQQMTAEMSNHYERVVESETLELRYGQNVNLEMACPSQIGVMPSTHNFNNDDLWPARTMRKRLFHLHAPENGDIGLVTVDFAMKIKSTEEDSLASTRAGTGSFHWTQPLSQQDPDYVNIIKDSAVTIHSQ